MATTLAAAAALAAPGLAHAEPARIMPVFSAPSRAESSDDSARRDHHSSSGDFESRPPRFEPHSGGPTTTRSTVERDDSSMTPTLERATFPRARRELPAGSVDLARGVHRRDSASDDSDEVAAGDGLPPPPPTVRRRGRRGRPPPTVTVVEEEGLVAGSGCDVSVCAPGAYVRGSRLSIGVRAGAMGATVVDGAGFGGGLAVGYHVVPSLSLEIRGDGYTSLGDELTAESFSMGWFSAGLVWYFGAGAVVQFFLTAGADLAFVARASAPDLGVIGGGHLGLGVVVAIADQADLLLEARGLVAVRGDDIAEAGVLATLGVDWYL